MIKQVKKYINTYINSYIGLPKEVYVIFISRIVNSIGNFVFPLLTFILTQRIGLNEAAAGTLMTTLMLIGGPGAIIGGKLVDTIGRKRIIVIFQSLGATLLFICGLMEPNMIMVYVFMASSIMYSFCGPAHDAMIADITNPENRKQSYSLLYLGHNFGFAVGPIIAGLLYKNHLSWIFFGDALTTIIALVLIFIFIKETMNKDEENLQSEERILERKEHGSVFRILFKRPILIIFAVLLFVYNFAYTQWSFTLPLQMKNLYLDNGAKFYSFIAGFNAVIVIVFTPLITELTHTIKPIRVIAMGGALYAIAFGGFAFANILPSFFILIFVMTIGEILISINSSTFIANNTPASHRGRVGAILPIIFGLGYCLGPMVMGNVIAVTNVKFAWIIIGVSTMISAFFMFILEKLQRKTELSSKSIEA